MKIETKELLEDVIAGKLQILKEELSMDDEDKTESVSDVINLCKAMIEDDKVKLDNEEKIKKRETDERTLKEARETDERTLKEARESDEKFKEQQEKNQKWDRRIKYGLDAASIGLPLLFYGMWMRQGFRFEETGTYTSQTFRSLFGRFSPKR